LIITTLPQADHESFKHFLEKRQEISGSADIRPDVVSRFGEYVEAFKDWMEAKKVLEKPPGETETSSEPTKETDWYTWINEWINLRKSQDPDKGFRGFVLSNQDKFRNAPEEIQAKARKKWASLYPGEPWPLDKPDGFVPILGGEESVDDRPTLMCPKENDAVLISYCDETCPDKAECKAYKEYYGKMAV